ncbi:MAG: hypothetical protein A3F83_16395 [Candidatus Glassbacteria bacterium RIFCSPLOWO2_12_FULL_58_11]|uniref:Glycosyltransferase subfamily 4-like N-terminal domain-containing protein n=1 Tax=Candidatus Glassbacteria bacterium RIFCSPLOWO2_12_FULL_58_11 TaxID=1817867 RepID=A0A1F5YMM7_9BACT|nr:MAG: hypothetical protein A3F83_16395 [Candidatus Glassbacteria bacterium RIFCSPLOWO2_12_FULL_58_11]
MKVLFLVPYPPQGASNRFRVLQFLPYLEKAGIACRVRAFYNERLWSILYARGRLLRKIFYGLACALNRLLDLARCLAYDVVFIHREAFPVGPAWFEALLRLLGKPYVYDFDDALFLPNVARPNRRFGKLKCPGKTASIIRGSRVTIAGNSYLAEYAGRSGAKKIVILPTVVDTGAFVPLAGKRDSGRVVIGWIGSPTTIEFLEDFRPVIDEVLSRCPDQACFRIVGGRLEGELPPGVSCLPWSLDTELRQLQDFDIGIMPMPDDEWTRGKCAFKAIEYMAVGIPAVCSPVGMNLELIQPGVSGFLPAGRREWVEILCTLVGDKSLRERVGREGRKLIETSFSLRMTAPRFKKAILDAGSEKLSP